jgi:UDP-glucose:(heptosyl)LPS alpha-1,3-glucosyltransferase
MQIAFCLFRYYPFGGLERDFLRIAKECLRRGFAVDVLTMKWEGAVPSGMKVTTIAVDGLSNHARCRSFARQLPTYLMQKKYDCVIGFNRLPGLDLYFAADVCYVASAKQKHGPWYRLTPRYHTYAALEKAVFSPQASTKILLLCQAEKKYFMQHYGTQIERFIDVPAGIDKAKFAIIPTAEVRQTVKTALGLNDEQFFLLMVGSDFKRKGVDRALQALAALPAPLREKTYLKVVGKGKVQPMQRLAKALKIDKQVEFLGPRDDVPSLMFAADLLLHPAYQETAGMVLLEALVARLPAIVTANCGYAYHIAQAEAGYLVPVPYRQAQLNECLIAALTQHERLIWQQNAKKYSETVDLYSLPSCAVNAIEACAREKKR